MQDLKRGDTGSVVAYAQERLTALGFGPITETEVFGPVTAQEVENLQRAALLEPTGEIDGDTWDALLRVDLGAEEVLSFDSELPEKRDIWPLEPDDIGPDVLVLQDWLSSLGFAAPATGVMDAATVAALEAFQASSGLPTRGCLDEDTGIVLLHVISERFPGAAGEERDEDDGAKAFESPFGARDVAGRGGYVYRQFEDGTLRILVAPHGRGVGTTLRSGAAWEAIVAEVGPYVGEAVDGPEPLAVLQRGSRGPEVTEVQTRLNALGIGPLSTDGIFGRGTADAVKRFQGAVGLQVDGRVDERTHGELFSERPPLGPGCDAAVLRTCQQALMALGFAPGVCDGAWGSSTEEAVRRFQAAYGLPVDGKIDERTWGTLLSVESVRVPSALIAAERERLLGQAREAAQSAPASILAVLEEAIRWLGTCEVPSGSNGGPDIDRISGGYYEASYERVHGKPPWCALACSHWVKTGLGATRWKDVPFKKRFGAAFQFEDWGRAQGRWSAASAPAPVGSVFVMSRSGSGSDSAANSRAGHVGLVIRDLGDSVLTIEGNVSDRVKSNTRSKAKLSGYVTWA